jgi:hypothetical protein
VHDLRPGVHAAIGPAGGGDADRIAGDRRERRLERILDGAAARLRLPAEKAAAVVFDA